MATVLSVFQEIQEEIQDLQNGFSTASETKTSVLQIVKDAQKAGIEINVDISRATLAAAEGIDDNESSTDSY